MSVIDLMRVCTMKLLFISFTGDFSNLTILMIDINIFIFNTQQEPNRGGGRMRGRGARRESAGKKTVNNCLLIIHLLNIRNA